MLWGELSEGQQPGLPGEEDALHDVEVLHEHVTLRLGAQVAHGVADAQLDGPLQSGRCGLQGNAATSRPLGRPLPRPWTPGHLRSTCQRPTSLRPVTQPTQPPKQGSGLAETPTLPHGALRPIFNQGSRTFPHLKTALTEQGSIHHQDFFLCVWGNTMYRVTPKLHCHRPGFLLPTFKVIYVVMTRERHCLSMPWFSHP